jgi:hypothetical protein
VHAVLDGILGREDQHGGLEPALPQRGQDLNAVAPREHQIEEDHVEGFVVDEEESFLAVRRDADVIVLRLKPFAKGLGHLPVVLDNQDSHVCPAPVCDRTRDSGRILHRC